MKKIIFSFSFLFLLLGSSSSALGAASLSLSPATGNVTVGQTIEISVNIDTGIPAATAADVVLNFNPNFLSVSKIDWGSAFGNQSGNPTIDNNAGRIILHATTLSSAYAFTGQGVVAKITFSGKAAGTSQSVFTCTPATTQNDSNIWSSSADIINCASNTGGNYTVISSGGGTPQPTATPTTANGSDNTEATPTPSQLLDSGVSEWTFLLIGFGVFFLIGGVRLLLAKKS